jgi:hypothetical protein
VIQKIHRDEKKIVCIQLTTKVSDREKKRKRSQPDKQFHIQRMSEKEKEELEKERLREIQVFTGKALKETRNGDRRV